MLWFEKMAPASFSPSDLRPVNNRSLEGCTLASKLNPIVLSESRYGHQARAFGVACLVGYLTLPKAETNHWSNPLTYVVLVLAYLSLLGIFGYPLYWVYALFRRHPVVMSACFIGGGIAALVEAPNPVNTAQFAPYLVVAVIMFLTVVGKFLDWALSPERNSALEASIKA